MKINEFRNDNPRRNVVQFEQEILQLTDFSSQAPKHT